MLLCRKPKTNSDEKHLLLYSFASCLNSSTRARLNACPTTELSALTVVVSVWQTDCLVWRSVVQRQNNTGRTIGARLHFYRVVAKL